MSKPKILNFAPREEPPEIRRMLEEAGCEIVIGDRAWQQPRSNHEDSLIAAAREAVALVGTSIRHTPISRRVMEASQRLRIVAKYTVGWTTWTSRPRPTSASWCAMRRPRPTASASPKPPWR
jgi:phosphoglycerate dehydrogenase-like enzyme